jgi:hypothetical protein
VIYVVQPNGWLGTFATITGEILGDGMNMAVVPEGVSGGFTPGDVFLPYNNGIVGQGTDKIVRITNNGATINTSWASFTTYLGAPVQYLYLDTTGLFGNNLLAFTIAGELWQITASGTATRLFSNLPSPYGDGSMMVVPNSPNLYGPLAGKLVVVGDGSPGFTVDTSGNVAYPFGTTGTTGINNAESIAIVPPAQSFYAIADSNQTLWSANGSQFAPLTNQIVVGHAITA